MSSQGDGQILAYCARCHLPFPFAETRGGAFALGLGGQSVHIGSMNIGRDGFDIQGSSVSCPRCGTMGSIPSGTYRFIRDNARLVGSLSAEDATATIDILRRIQAGADASDSLLESLPDETREIIAGYRNNDNFKWITSLLFALLLFFFSTSSTDHLTDDVKHLSAEVQANNEYERCLLEELAPTIREAANELPRSAKMDKRNERVSGSVGARRSSKATNPENHLNNAPRSEMRSVPNGPISKTDVCWCGSGRKFQKCHGRRR